MSPHRLRLVLADDHRLVLEGLRRLLEESFDLVAIATDGAELLAEVARARPDIVVTDLAMPGMGGIEAIRSIQRLDHPPGIIVLSMHADAANVRQAMRAGARAYVLKNAAGTELVRAIHEVHEGRRYISPTLSDLPVLDDDGTDEPRPATTPLTPRQCQVLELTARGYRMKQVAEALHISWRTVESHKYQLMETLGATSTADLVRHAVELGLIDVDHTRPAPRTAPVVRPD